MKKLERQQMKNLKGGNPPGGGGAGCTQTYTGCNIVGGEVKCDYHISCSNGYEDDLCHLQCQNPGDGDSCLE